MDQTAASWNQSFGVVEQRYEKRDSARIAEAGEDEGDVAANVAMPISNCFQNTFSFLNC